MAVSESARALCRWLSMLAERLARHTSGSRILELGSGRCVIDLSLSGRPPMGSEASRPLNKKQKTRV